MGYSKFGSKVDEKWKFPKNIFLDIRIDINLYCSEYKVHTSKIEYRTTTPIILNPPLSDFSVKFLKKGFHIFKIRPNVWIRVLIFPKSGPASTQEGCEARARECFWLTHDGTPDTGAQGCTVCFSINGRAVKADFRDFTIMYHHFLVGQRKILEQKIPEMNELGSPLSNACLTFKIGSVVLKVQ